MMCPDWEVLAATRERLASSCGSGVDDIEREWHAAVEHRRECSACRADARQADPLTVFLDLPEIQLEPGAIEAMQQRVAGARRLLGTVDRRGESRFRRALRRRGVPSVAAAAILLALGLASSPRLGQVHPTRIVDSALEAWFADGDVDEEGHEAARVFAQNARVAQETKDRVFEHLGSLPPVEGEMEVTFRVEGGSFELVQLGSFGH